jgi:hypothetical protein
MTKEYEEGVNLLAWLTENYVQIRPNGFARRDDERPSGFQRLYTIHELLNIYIPAKEKIYGR